MTAEQITVSLEWAKKLKAAGWPQDETSFYWTWSNHFSREPEICLRYCEDPRFKKLAVDQRIAAAPTAEEILRNLPKWLYCKRSSFGPGERWMIGDVQGHVLTPPEIRDIRIVEFDALANAAAAMYCYLAEHSLFPPQK